MRISDWSSDVCSSDLRDARERLVRRAFGEQRHQRLALRAGDAALVDDQDALRPADRGEQGILIDRAEPAQVDHQRLHAIVRQDFLGLPRKIISIAIADDRQIAPFAMHRSEENTSELQSLMRLSYTVFCLQKKRKNIQP